LQEFVKSNEFFVDAKASEIGVEYAATNNRKIWSKEMETIKIEKYVIDCAAYAGGEVNAFRQALVSETYKERQLALSKYGWEENYLDTVPSYRLGQARLNAVYGVGVLKEQMIEFLDEQNALYSGDK